MVDRRSVVSAALGVTTGAIWFGGMSLLARGRDPHVLVAGAGTWQVVLLEHRSVRMLVISGDGVELPDASVTRILGLLRPDVDLLAATSATLGSLAPSRMEALSPSTFIALDSPGDPAPRPGWSTVGNGLETHLGDFRLVMRPVISGAWTGGGVNSWCIEGDVGPHRIAIAPSLDMASRAVPRPVDLAIAPVGDAGRLVSRHPGAGLAINASAARAMRPTESGTAGQRTFRLVRIYPRDIAQFRFAGGNMTLPRWSENVVLPTSD